MKGWIKVHKLSEIDNKSHIMYVRAEDVVQVLIGKSTCICLRGEEDVPYAVDETVEEVLALIKEAEKPKKSLYEELKRVVEECEKHASGSCVGCPYLTPEGEEAYWACRAFGDCPEEYDLDEIPEEYR